MIRLFGFLAIATIAAGGTLAIDYQSAAKSAEGLTVTDYLSGLPDRLAKLTSAAGVNGGGASLAEMLPKPPEGWTVRPVAADDVDEFLPKSKRKADKTATGLIKEMVQTSAKGAEVVALAYENSDRTVLIRAVRHPDSIFTDAAAIDQRVALQDLSAQFRGTEFLTVRGLDVTEDLLPKDFRGRYFLADVGSQIQLRVVAPKRMKDVELVPFFETLHVQAMNASVVDKVEGLGDAPVILVASALSGADREAYDAAVTARTVAEDQRHDAARQAAEAENAAKTPASAGATGTAAEGSLLSGIVGSLFGEKKPATPEEVLADHQDALIEAARSGDAAGAAAHSAAIYGAIAEELGSAEGKFVSKSGAGIGTPTNKSKIKVGIGSCVVKDGRKSCAVGGSD